MNKEKWNETGRIWKEDHAWLDETQRAQCTRAHDSDMFQSPIPTRMISNGPSAAASGRGGTRNRWALR